MAKPRTARKRAARVPSVPSAAAEAGAVDGLSPRSLRRRQEILDAAAAVFLEKGFTGCSIDDVISRTGGSKRTVYKLFPSKRDLFVAIARDLTGKVLQPIDLPKLTELPVEDALQEFGERLLQMMTSSEFSRFYRGVIGEAIRFPEIAAGVFDAGPARLRSALTEALAHFEARGELVLANREAAAEQFISMLRTEQIFAVALGLRPPPDKAAIRRTVAQVVSIFLNGCRKRR